MNTLDKIYNLSVDIRNIEGKYNSYAKFFDDDRKTSIIRVRLLNNGTPINLEGCIVEAYFVLANNSYHSESCKIVNSSEGEIELELCQECLVIGENIVRISISKGDEIANTPIITYSVKKGLYSDDNPNFNDDPLTPILNQMLLDVKVVQVNQIELQERYEKAFPQIEAKINEANDVIKSVNDAIASGTQDLEVKEARDGEATLKARLDRDIEKAKQVYVNVEGSNISTDSSVGYLKDVEILGNTIQDENNLADIRSVGDKLEGQELYKISVLCTNGLDSKDSEYQEDKLTILSPVQLEKVGDVADRIIEKDGVWGVEKNIGTILLDGSESWVIQNSANYLEGTKYFELKSTNGIYKIPNSNGDFSHLISSFIVKSPNDLWNATVSEGISFNRNGYIIMRCECQSVAELNDKLTKTHIITKLALITPQFIPLPHDQQIKLRTFANKTNISFLTEIEGTIKAQVPKSLGATVNTHTEQINNLNKELDRVKKLEESTVSTVTTESDFTTVEATSNGYFEDVKLEGKTLVNLSNLSRRNITITKNDSSCKITPLRQLTSSDVLYLSFNCTSLTFDSAFGIIYSITYSDGTPTKYIEIPNGKVVGYKQAKIVPKGNVSSIAIYLHSQNSSGSTATISDVVLMYEKDYDTQNPPSYFEGLKSVGQSASEDGADEIVVESVDDNINNRDNSFTEIAIADGGENRDKSVITTGFNHISADDDAVYLYRNGERSTNIVSRRYYSKNKVFLGATYTNDAYYVRFRFLNANGSYDGDISEYKVLNSTMKEGQSDKKRLLYYNNETQSWEKPILREWDSIEKHSDGKYYYHQRSGEVVLNGSEDWIKSPSDYQGETTGNVTFHLPFVSISSWDNSNYLICDVIPSRVGSEGVWRAVAEGITTDSSKIMISILKSKLSTQDVQGFKQWLQTNNVTVVYPLEQEKVYECTNIDLITYANETNYIVESGAISPRTTLKVHNNISNVVSLLQKKVSLLESNVTSYMITQNRLMLASRYNADTVSFKVDVATLRNSFEYDNDLYELILNNILVGKDNYNREYIENLIIFYWMDFVISDEMYITLFEIIEEQHNPKVIEDEAPIE